MQKAVKGCLVMCILFNSVVLQVNAKPEQNAVEEERNRLLSYLSMDGFEWADNLTLEELGAFLGVDVSEYQLMYDTLVEYDAKLVGMSEKITAIEMEYVLVEDILQGTSGLADSSLLPLYRQEYEQEYGEFARLKEEFANSTVTNLLYEYAMIESDRLVAEAVRNSVYTVKNGEVLFQYPIKDYYVTSPYGARIHPIYNIEKFHSGIDLVSQGGDLNVCTVADGVVLEAGYSAGYGNYVIVSHGTLSTVYAHMQEVYVHPDSLLLAGDSIGLMGSTGVSTGVHLHLEIRDTSGKTVDPNEFLDFSGSRESKEEELLTADRRFEEDTAEEIPSFMEESDPAGETEGIFIPEDKYDPHGRITYNPGVRYDGLSQQDILQMLAELGASSEEDSAETGE